MDLVQLSISIEQRKLVFDLESETKIGVKFKFLERYFLRGPFRFNREPEPRYQLCFAIIKFMKLARPVEGQGRGGGGEGEEVGWMGAASLWTVDN